MVLGIKYYTGYYGCGRCETKGKYKENRLCFPEVTATLRTDESFEKFKNGDINEHHKHETILTSMGIKCISQVPLDVMHLVYEGVVRKMVYICVSCTNKKIRWSTRHVEIINGYLMKSKITQPAEFSRRIRPISDYGLFKATELRTLLLYTGMVAFKDVLPESYYNHFLLLCCAVRVLSNRKTFISKNSTANAMLRQYVLDFGKLYGEYLISYNVHNLIHLADEVVIQNKPIEDFATWVFESYNCTLKRFGKKQRHYLQQAFNRVSELYNSTLTEKKKEVYPVIRKEIVSNEFDEIIFENFKINSNITDKWFITKENQIVRFKKVVNTKTNMNLKIVGNIVLNYTNFFEEPLKSSHVGIYKCYNLTLSDDTYFEPFEVVAKIFCIEEKLNEYVFITLL